MGTILYLRALQGHSGSNLIDATLQDNVIIHRGLYQHIYHIGCALNLHSIINNGLILGGQGLSTRQTVFFLPIDLVNEDNLSKKVINLLRDNQKLHREDDGAIQFYKIQFHLRDYPLPFQNWSGSRWIACLAAGGGPKRRYQYCSDYFGSIIFLRALQGHSGNSLVDLALQDNVLIEPGIFPYIYHVGSNFNLKSIISNGLIPGGQDLSKRQSVFFLPTDPRKEDHKDPEYIDCSVPRTSCTILAKYMEETSRHGVLGRY